MNSAVFVGMTRFELATSGPPDRCATGLRHIPRASAPDATDAAKRHDTRRGFRSFEKQRLHVLFRGYNGYFVMTIGFFCESGCKSTTIFAEKQLFSPKSVQEWHNYCFLQTGE